MLDTLIHQQVRGGKWHTLIDKVWDRSNLAAAAHKAIGNAGAPGVDQQTVQDFDQHFRTELAKIHQQLCDGEYTPAPVRRTWINKPGSQEKRPLGIPTIRDRVVQTALVHVIEPIIDNTFHPQSYGFRHQRGCHDALRRVEELLQDGDVYVVDADLKSYFDTIPKDRLLQLVQNLISDHRVIKLIQQYLDQGILEDLKLWTPLTGVPQGAVLSPVLANLYLNPLDHLMSESGYEMVRYADDFIILCRTRAEAETALQQVQAWVTENGLTLHPTKTRIANANEEGFSFLGYIFRGRFRFPREKSHQKFLEGIHSLTRRRNGLSMDEIIGRLNSKLTGWFHYFRHCFWNIFKDYDQRIRTRLRRLLQKRHRRNPKRLPAPKRWPNAYFQQLGLCSLNGLHLQFVQSHLGTY